MKKYLLPSILFRIGQKKKKTKNTIFIIFIFVSVICGFDTYAQVTYEHTYLTSTIGYLGQEFFVTNLGNNDYKYVIYDYRYATFSLYNLNYTPFMLNIQIPVISDSANGFYYRLGYISTTLFDCDSSNIEYAMMSDSPNLTHFPNFAIYRTDGTVIFSKDTVGTFFVLDVVRVAGRCIPL